MSSERPKPLESWLYPVNCFKLVPEHFCGLVKRKENEHIMEARESILGAVVVEV